MENINMTDTKKVLSLLKKVKEEKGLSLDAILRLMEENGDYVSKSTLSRVFSDNADETCFRYETTLRPIADALLDLETIEQDDDTDTQAYKSLLKLKRDIIEELTKANEQTKIDYAVKLEEETERYQRSIAFVNNQIALKDQRIDDLLEMNKKLMETNNKLINQLMNCPLRKEC